jgi:uncharacterized protein (TIGR03790 family)
LDGGRLLCFAGHLKDWTRDVGGLPFCIATSRPASWNRSALRSALRTALVFAMLAAAGAPSHAQTVSPAIQQAVIEAAEAASAASAAAAAPAPAPAVRRPAWIQAPRIGGRLQAADIGVVINTNDPLSVQVGQYYINARHLKAKQVLRLSVPARPVLTAEEFESLREAINKRFGPATQALALAWTVPYAVGCNAITGALALGFNAELCKQSCAASRPSPYFNSPSFKPFKDFGFRPAMLLAARNFEDAKALIDRGVAADGQMSQRGRPPVSVLMLSTDDVPRRVRMALYPPAGLVREYGLDVKTVPEAELQSAKHILLAITGSVQAKLLPKPDWVAGALADHLTSYGGDLLGQHGQGTILDWLESGATASHGAVSEPCNHLQKFPHPQVLLLHYAQGSTALEAYWKSVLWPQQSLFVGEPLAAPFLLTAPTPTQFSAPRLLP